MTHLEETKKTKIALTGGSTGGHVFPLLSAYNYFQEEGNYDFIWVGEEGNLEEKIALENNIDFLDIPAGKIRRYFDWKNFYEPFKNLTGIIFGIFYILKNKIDIVFSKGGYVALPLCIAAFILRKPIYIHESDRVSGVANKLIGKIATKVFYTFPNENIDNEKNIVSGQILNPELLDNLNSLELEQNSTLSILVMGGSQGSTRIFDAMLKLMPDFKDIHFNIILGEKNLHFKSDFNKYLNVKTYDFVNQRDLGRIYKDTDIAITRGGATSLWELQMFGIHSIIVPLTESAGNHQMLNAKYFNEKFSSDIVDENNDFEIALYRKLKSLRGHRKSRLHLEGFFKSLQIIESEIK